MVNFKSYERYFKIIKSIRFERRDKMDFNIKEGISFESKKIVKEDMLASNFGSGDINVFATPIMIAMIEETALKLVDPKLPDEYATVGYNVNVDHIAPTPLAMEVTAEVELEKIEDRKLTFKVKVFDEKELVGKGTHQRFIVNVDKLQNKS